jgi:hypothetical protein
MRYFSVVAVASVIALPTTALAEPEPSRLARAERGFHMEQGAGPAAYRAGLAAYGQPGLRIELGLGFRRDAWTVALLGGGIALEPATDCYSGCGPDGRHGSYFYYGVDFRRAWPLGRLRGPRLSIDAVLHAGPRYFFGDHALTGYMGPGLGAGARIEVNAWAIGAYVGVGYDLMAMQIAVDGVVGATPHGMFGVKLGWL